MREKVNRDSVAVYRVEAGMMDHQVIRKENRAKKCGGWVYVGLS